MNQAASSSPGDHTGAGPRYVHTTTAAEHRRLERRTVETSAAFLLPHLRPGMRLLDCGCGPGSITVGLAAAVAPGETIGLDLQPAQVERARLLAAEQSVSNVRFDLGSVYELPFPDGSFDAAFAHNLLVHLADPLRAVREMRRVLRPGGVIGIADDDLGTRLWEPPTPLLTELSRVFRQAIQHHGGDPYRARHHRRLLLDAGFARPIAGASLGTGGVWGTPEETRLFAAWYAEQIRAPAFFNLVTAQGWVDSATLEAMAAEVLAWGERPDAFVAVMGVTALGWVDGLPATHS
jgi:ubiquinone/menaquinone biosynthesis C-methylase UbiE